MLYYENPYPLHFGECFIKHFQQKSFFSYPSNLTIYIHAPKSQYQTNDTLPTPTTASYPTNKRKKNEKGKKNHTDLEE